MSWILGYEQRSCESNSIVRKTIKKNWKKEIENFLKEKLKLELHPDKPRIICLSRGIDFVGFRNLYNYKLLRKRNVRNMQRKIHSYSSGEMPLKKLLESFEGWNAYAKWSNSYKLRKRLINKVIKSNFP